VKGIESLEDITYIHSNDSRFNLKENHFWLLIKAPLSIKIEPLSNLKMLLFIIKNGDSPKNLIPLLDLYLNIDTYNVKKKIPTVNRFSPRITSKWISYSINYNSSSKIFADLPEILKKGYTRVYPR